MKVRCTIVLLCFVAFLFSCTSNPPVNQNAITQKISSVKDCESNKGWTWGSNGVASIGSEAGYIWDKCFEIRVKVSGELTLSYKRNNSNKASWIQLYDESYERISTIADIQNSEYIKGSLGKVESGSLVNVCGFNVSVKDVMITGEHQDNSPWDF